MLTKNIKFKNYIVRSNISKVKREFKKFVSKENEILSSLSLKYKYSYSKRIIKKYKNFSKLQIIGIGGSTLGTEAIYSFLRDKIKKNFFFINTIKNETPRNKGKKTLNLIVSKSGNTLETISNSNIFINKNDKNIFITENKQNYLHSLAQKLKADIVHHNNYIGGRYSVLSEVGMLPAELMGLKSKNFRQFNSLIKNTKFMNSLVQNVSSTLYFLKNKKFNSVILNYDEMSQNLFYWYQQLIAESLGKKNKGLLPIVSSVPKDNHSVMQLYLDGFKNNFYTFFYVHGRRNEKINKDKILISQKFLKNKTVNEIVYAQKKATEKVFNKKNIPFRSFEIKSRDEKTLGELFCFFILETILIGKCLKINPYDQPAVELIKKQTKKLLI